MRKYYINCTLSPGKQNKIKKKKKKTLKGRFSKNTMKVKQEFQISKNYLGMNSSGAAQQIRQVAFSEADVSYGSHLLRGLL